MNKLRWIVPALLLLPIIASSKPKASDPLLQDRFEKRIKAYPGIDTRAFDEDLTQQQRDLLTFLYANMALADLADHDSYYFLENLNLSLRAKNELPWGKDIPEREFKHFVVPIRVNDEPLDNHRKLFYAELFDRVKDLSAEEAVLEVNHWCHEKATYQPSDGRTHSPLQTVYTAIGRCGEESTFTVSALRSIGIPARQVYTPRWAHTDDNHAWVEAYAGGKWYFLGACEPEPVLNLGWFNAPASRGILMNTRVLGRYDGPEEVLFGFDDYTDINVTENYAPTDSISVMVYNADGSLSDSAKVDFRVYNYAEFYPLTSRSFRGKPVSLNAGKGDLLVWASDGTNFGYSQTTVGTNKQIDVVLNHKAGNGRFVDEFTVTPPKSSGNMPFVSSGQAALNDARKLSEDSLRNSYCIDNFITKSGLEQAVAELKLDSVRLGAVLVDARANASTLLRFMKSLPADSLQIGLRLLEVMSQKDRSDVPYEVLSALLDNLVISPTPLFDEFVLSPRVANEQLSDFRTLFNGSFTEAERNKFKNSPAAWEKWVSDSITLVASWYPERVRMSAKSVLENRVANGWSRNIFFVLGARAFGIPARIDPVSGKTQWADSDALWHDADFGAEAQPAGITPQGYLNLTYEQAGRIDNPKYYAHYSISRIDDGRPVLLGFDDFAPWRETFKYPYPLDKGKYMLVTGQRMADGSVLSRIEMFDINVGDTVDVCMKLRQDTTGVQVIGNLNAENLYLPLGETAKRSLLSTTGRGYYVLGILNPGHEPSVHAINDLSALSKELDEAGRPIMILTPDSQTLDRLTTELKGKDMPSLHLGIDSDGVSFNELVESLRLNSDMLPVFVIADTFNRVVYVTQGYTIGLGDKLLDILHRID